jgi:hypothetical protein
MLDESARDRTPLRMMIMIIIIITMLPGKILPRGL